jgi:large subunit ribosomal protein L19
MNLLERYERKHIERLSVGKNIPDFKPGCQLVVDIEIVEGATKRVQAFEGVCIARKNRGIASKFVVSKLSHGAGVERSLLLYSPRIVGIKVVRRGKVRRAKLYYLRDLRGKAARLKEEVKKRA